MATSAHPTAAKTSSSSRQLMRRDRGMFSASDDSAMMKQIQATHSPDGRELEVRPILHVIEAILHQVAPGIDGLINVQFTKNKNLQYNLPKDL